MNRLSQACVPVSSFRSVGCLVLFFSVGCCGQFDRKSTNSFRFVAWSAHLLQASAQILDLSTAAEPPSDGLCPLNTSDPTTFLLPLIDSKYANESVLDEEYSRFVHTLNASLVDYCLFNYQSPCEHAGIYNAIRRCLATYPEFSDPKFYLGALQRPHPRIYEIPDEQLPMNIKTDFYITRISRVDSKEMVKSNRLIKSD